MSRIKLHDRPEKTFEMDMVLRICGVTREPIKWAERSSWKDEHGLLPDGFYISDTSNMVYVLINDRVIWVDSVERFFYDVTEQ